MTVEIVEKIEYGEFDSQAQGLYLVSRDAPTPSEKLVTENLDYMNGILDFSNITGERLYEQREISYQFVIVNAVYAQRKVLENRIKGTVMRPYDQRLYDSHDKGVYWLGKCKGVKVTDDHEHRKLTVTIDFSLYPFAIKDSSDSRFLDDWDSFDFENDFAQPYAFNVNGAKTIRLMNIGESRISPTVIASTSFQVVIDGKRFDFSPDKSTDFLFSLAQGMNELTVYGTGTIKFVLKTEVMI